MDKKNKVFDIAGLTLGSLLIYLNYASNNPSYHISYYFGTIMSYWYIFILFYIMTLVYFMIQEEQTPLHTMAVFVFLMSTMLLAPSLTGEYIHGKSDVLTHLGHLVYIKDSNNIYFDNIYPIFHILTSQISLTTSLPMNYSVMRTNYFMYLIFVIGCVNFHRILNSGNENLPPAILVYSLPIIGNATVYFTPYNSALLFTVFLLPYIYIKETIKQNVIILSILIISLVIMHPLVGFLVTSAYIIGEVLIRSGNQMFGYINRSSGYKNIGIAILGVVFTIAWIDRIGINDTGPFSRRISSAIVQVLSPDPTSRGYYNSTQSQANTVSFELVDIIKAFIFRYGEWPIIFFIIFLGAYYMHSTIITGPKNKNIYYSGYVASAVLLACGIFSFFIELSGANFQRFILLSMVISMVPGVSHAVSSNNKYIYKILVILIIILMLISVMSLYNSPTYNIRSSQKVTDSHVSGYEWIGDQIDNSRSIGHIYLRPLRFYHAIYGVDTYPPKETGIDKADVRVISNVGKQSYRTNYDKYPNYFPTSRQNYNEGYDMSNNKLYDNEGVQLYSRRDQYEG